MNTRLRNAFRKKKVVITGHTGFKGTWLTIWLEMLGAKIYGIGLEPNTSPSHFESARLSKCIKDIRLDIRDRFEVEKAISEIEPDFIFHLAAQALVKRSFEEVVETYETNMMGTIHILEALRKLKNPCSVVLITSDKSYNNVEWVWGYRENDALGGPDPYSASKGAAELAIRSYIISFFNNDHPVKIGVARAGNVIGGGDWAKDRIVPDCMRAWFNDDTVQIRNPNATRPWQHVLEPLSGYLCLAMELKEAPKLHGEAFNFGPSLENNYSVGDLVNMMSNFWEKVMWEDISLQYGGPHESGLLKLNCDKALHYLKWRSVWQFADTVEKTASWYRKFYEHSGAKIRELSASQIMRYMDDARREGLMWAM